KGIPQHDLGNRTDVLDACPKAEGMMMLIRSMSPEVLVVDEIGSRKDAEALMEVINAGVTVICSVHANSFEQLRNRPSFQLLLDHHIFKRFVILKREPFPGSIQSIFNGNENDIWNKGGIHL
ncbi:MAG TPA: stage III sporulation protein AA, partial [Pseudogracilibacillus sp.]|nr:stage III sporulation protein AA [Pseudogracilibacillus sp.]